MQVSENLHKYARVPLPEMYALILKASGNQWKSLAYVWNQRDDSRKEVKMKLHLKLCHNGNEPRSKCRIVTSNITINPRLVTCKRCK